MNNLIEWLPKNIPTGKTSNLISLIHGDYRLENVIFHPTQNKIVAILDWELSTIGHPLSELGYSFGLMYYTPNVPPMPGIDWKEIGVFPLEFYLKKYCDILNIELENWDFYVILNIFKLAGIAQGVYKRAIQGNASSTKALSFGIVPKIFGQCAWDLVLNSANKDSSTKSNL